MLDLEQISENLQAIQSKVAETAKSAGRKASEIRLVAVTKGHPKEAIEILAGLGVADIGESYVEEAAAKQMALGETPSVKWHMLGHIQSRKAADVASKFDMLHSVDSLKVAERLNRFAGEVGKVLPILLEVNIAAEPSKYGWSVSTEAEEAFFEEVVKINSLPSLRIAGLMSMAPMLENPENARPFFARTRELRDALAARVPDSAWSELSMGMSDDFEAAILEGSTMVRIGTAILGARTI